jgi:cobalt-precorrin 5A hydrolase
MARDIVIAAGFGFRSAATADSLADALARAGGTPNVLATAGDKASSPAFLHLAERMGLPIAAIDTAALRAQTTLTQSHASRAARGTGSVAEAAALAAAGPGARLLSPRVVSADGMSTCALAEGAPR